MNRSKPPSHGYQESSGKAYELLIFSFFTLSHSADYKAAQQRLLFDLLQPLPIPTNRDMDELYKEIYLLKKTVRELTRKVAEH